MIALLAAVPLETELLRAVLSPCEVVDFFGLSLYRGRLYGAEVELLHTGAGKASAAATAALLVQRSPAAIFVVGCGGAYPGSGLRVGDLALASSESFGDEGVITPDGFRDLRAMGLPSLAAQGARFYNELPVAEAWLTRARARLTRFAADAGLQLACGPFVTVSTCSGTAAAGAELTQRTGGICENMEGAAIALVCARHRIPFCEVRGISNLVEDRDLSRWDLKGGARHAQQALLALFQPVPKALA